MTVSKYVQRTKENHGQRTKGNQENDVPSRREYEEVEIVKRDEI